MSEKKIKLPYYRISKRGIITAYISINGVRVNKKFNSVKELEEFMKNADKARYSLKGNQHKTVYPFGYVYDRYIEHLGDELTGSQRHWEYCLRVIPLIRKKMFYQIDYDYLVDSFKKAKSNSKKGATYQFLMMRFAILLEKMNLFVKMRQGKLGDCADPMELKLWKERVKIKDVRKLVQPEDCHHIPDIVKFYEFLSEPIYVEFTCVNRKPNAIKPTFEYKRLRFENQEPIRHMYMVGIGTGCRVGELCSLKKDNWDPVTKVLTVNSTIVTNKYDKLAGKHISYDQPFTKTKVIREISIENDLIAKALDWLKAFGDSEFLFPHLNPKYNKKHSWQCPRSYSRTMKELCVKAGVRPLASHKMNRKTYATLLTYEALVEGKKNMREIIRDLTLEMGWKSESVALDYIVPLVSHMKQTKKSVFSRIQSQIEGITEGATNVVDFFGKKKND